MLTVKRNTFTVIVACIFIFLMLTHRIPAFSQDADKSVIYQDHTQSFEVRVDDLVSRMTLEEKVSQMMSRTPANLPRLGIPGYEWSGQATHCLQSRYGGSSTIFPHAIAQASTWNKELVYKIATAISDESRAQFNSGYERAGLTFWAPVVELARDPRWGRTHECYGEDPYLTSQISLAYVQGIQGNDPRYLKAIAAPKHFVANNEEWNRHNGSSDIDEQLLREYYLRPYRVLVEEGKAQSMMAAYNRLNGVPCLGNKMLLTDILRGEWGFEGSVVTDCNGLKDLFQGHNYVANEQEAIALVMNAGIDMECGNYFKKHLLQVVKSGAISEEVIDTSVRRLMLSRFRLGLYDPPEMVPYNNIPISVVDSPEHRALARQAAREAIILLKNENKLLPLQKDTIQSIAVIGPNADVCQMGGYTGSYSVAVSPLDGIKNRLGDAKVQHVKGTDIKITLPRIPTDYLVPPNAKPGEHGLLGEYFNNVDCSGEPAITRIDPVIDFDYSEKSPDVKIRSDYFSVRWSGQFIAPATGPYYIGGLFDDAIRFYFDGKSVIDMTKNRNQSSAAVKVDLQKGQHYDLLIEFTEHWYESKIKLWGAPQDSGKFKKAIQLAKSADVAIVVLGTDETVEKEGVDRPNLKLPGDQQELIKAVLKANPKTVLVMQNGSPLSINWAKEHVPAILETFYNGEEGGNALVDVLFGDYNPAGRLPLTVYKSVEQLPSISDYDIRKGRTYMYQKESPLYPFGFGLSYTEFKYDNLSIAAETITPEEDLRVSVVVTNVGNRPGDEVVQLYIKDLESSVERPLQQLVGFERISLMPNESKTVRFSVPAAELAFWDQQASTYVVESGRFDVMVGGSSKDIRHKGHFGVK